MVLPLSGPIRMDVAGSSPAPAGPLPSPFAAKPEKPKTRPTPTPAPSGGLIPPAPAPRRPAASALAPKPDYTEPEGGVEYAAELYRQTGKIKPEEAEWLQTQMRDLESMKEDSEDDLDYKRKAVARVTSSVGQASKKGLNPQVAQTLIRKLRQLAQQLAGKKIAKGLSPLERYAIGSQVAMRAVSRAAITPTITAGVMAARGAEPPLERVVPPEVLETGAGQAGALVGGTVPALGETVAAGGIGALAATGVGAPVAAGLAGGVLLQQILAQTLRRNVQISRADAYRLAVTQLQDRVKKNPQDAEAKNALAEAAAELTQAEQGITPLGEAAKQTIVNTISAAIPTLAARKLVAPLLSRTSFQPATVERLVQLSEAGPLNVATMIAQVQALEGRNPTPEELAFAAGIGLATGGAAARGAGRNVEALTEKLADAYRNRNFTAAAEVDEALKKAGFGDAERRKIDRTAQARAQQAAPQAPPAAAPAPQAAPAAGPRTWGEDLLDPKRTEEPKAGDRIELPSQADPAVTETVEIVRKIGGRTVRVRDAQGNESVLTFDPNTYKTLQEASAGREAATPSTFGRPAKRFAAVKAGTETVAPGEAIELTMAPGRQQSFVYEGQDPDGKFLLRANDGALFTFDSQRANPAEAQKQLRPTAPAARAAAPAPAPEAAAVTPETAPAAPAAPTAVDVRTTVGQYVKTVDPRGTARVIFVESYDPQTDVVTYRTVAKGGEEKTFQSKSDLFARNQSNELYAPAQAELDALKAAQTVDEQAAALAAVRAKIGDERAAAEAANLRGKSRPAISAVERQVNDIVAASPELRIREVEQKLAIDPEEFAKQYKPEDVPTDAPQALLDRIKARYQEGVAALAKRYRDILDDPRVANAVDEAQGNAVKAKLQTEFMNTLGKKDAPIRLSVMAAIRDLEKAGELVAQQFRRPEGAPEVPAAPDAVVPPAPAPPAAPAAPPPVAPEVRGETVPVPNPKNPKAPPLRFEVMRELPDGSLVMRRLSGKNRGEEKTYPPDNEFTQAVKAAKKPAASAPVVETPVQEAPASVTPAPEAPATEFSPELLDEARTYLAANPIRRAIIMSESEDAGTLMKAVKSLEAGEAPKPAAPTVVAPASEIEADAVAVARARKGGDAKTIRALNEKYMMNPFDWADAQRRMEAFAATETAIPAAPEAAKAPVVEAPVVEAPAAETPAPEVLSTADVLTQMRAATTVDELDNILDTAGKRSKEDTAALSGAYDEMLAKLEEPATPAGQPEGEVVRGGDGTEYIVVERGDKTNPWKIIKKRNGVWQKAPKDYLNQSPTVGNILRGEEMADMADEIGGARALFDKEPLTPAESALFLRDLENKTTPEERVRLEKEGSPEAARMAAFSTLFDFDNEFAKQQKEVLKAAKAAEPELEPETFVLDDGRKYEILSRTANEWIIRGPDGKKRTIDPRKNAVALEVQAKEAEKAGSDPTVYAITRGGATKYYKVLTESTLEGGENWLVQGVDEAGNVLKDAKGKPVAPTSVSANGSVTKSIRDLRRAAAAEPEAPVAAEAPIEVPAAKAEAPAAETKAAAPVSGPRLEKLGAALHKEMFPEGKNSAYKNPLFKAMSEGVLDLYDRLRLTVKAGLPDFNNRAISAAEQLAGEFEQVRDIGEIAGQERGTDFPVAEMLRKRVALLERTFQNVEKELAEMPNHAKQALAALEKSDQPEETKQFWREKIQDSVKAREEYLANMRQNLDKVRAGLAELEAELASKPAAAPAPETPAPPRKTFAESLKEKSDEELGKLFASRERDLQVDPRNKSALTARTTIQAEAAARGTDRAKAIEDFKDARLKEIEAERGPARKALGLAATIGTLAAGAKPASAATLGVVPEAISYLPAIGNYIVNDPGSALLAISSSVLLAGAVAGARKAAKSGFGKAFRDVLADPAVQRYWSSLDKAARENFMRSNKKVWDRIVDTLNEASQAVSGAARLIERPAVAALGENLADRFKLAGDSRRDFLKYFDDGLYKLVFEGAGKPAGRALDRTAKAVNNYMLDSASLWKIAPEINALTGMQRRLLSEKMRDVYDTVTQAWEVRKEIYNQYAQYLNDRYDTPADKEQLQRFLMTREQDLTPRQRAQFAEFLADEKLRGMREKLEDASDRLVNLMGLSGGAREALRGRYLQTFGTDPGAKGWAKILDLLSLPSARGRALVGRRKEEYRGLTEAFAEANKRQEFIDRRNEPWAIVNDYVVNVGQNPVQRVTLENIRGEREDINIEDLSNWNIDGEGSRWRAIDDPRTGEFKAVRDYTADEMKGFGFALNGAQALANTLRATSKQERRMEMASALAADPEQAASGRTSDNLQKAWKLRRFGYTKDLGVFEVTDKTDAQGRPVVKQRESGREMVVPVTDNIDPVTGERLVFGEFARNDKTQDFERNTKFTPFVMVNGQRWDVVNLTKQGNKVLYDLSRPGEPIRRGIPEDSVERMRLLAVPKDIRNAKSGIGAFKPGEFNYGALNDAYVSPDVHSVMSALVQGSTTERLLTAFDNSWLGNRVWKMLTIGQNPSSLATQTLQNLVTLSQNNASVLTWPKYMTDFTRNRDLVAELENGGLFRRMGSVEQAGRTGTGAGTQAEDWRTMDTVKRATAAYNKLQDPTITDVFRMWHRAATMAGKEATRVLPGLIQWQDAFARFALQQQFERENLVTKGMPLDEARKAAIKQAIDVSYQSSRNPLLANVEKSVSPFASVYYYNTFVQPLVALANPAGAVGTALTLGMVSKLLGTEAEKEEVAPGYTRRTAREEVERKVQGRARDFGKTGVPATTKITFGGKEFVIPTGKFDPSRGALVPEFGGRLPQTVTGLAQVFTPGVSMRDALRTFVGDRRYLAPVTEVTPKLDQAKDILDGAINTYLPLVTKAKRIISPTEKEAPEGLKYSSQQQKEDLGRFIAAVRLLSNVEPTSRGILFDRLEKWGTRQKSNISAAQNLELKKTIDAGTRREIEAKYRKQQNEMDARVNELRSLLEKSFATRDKVLEAAPQR